MVGIDVILIIFLCLASLAKHYHFDIETPFTELPKKIQDVILYGSGDEEIDFHLCSWP